MRDGLKLRHSTSDFKLIWLNAIAFIIWWCVMVASIIIYKPIYTCAWFPYYVGVVPLKWLDMWISLRPLHSDLAAPRSNQEVVPRYIFPALSTSYCQSRELPTSWQYSGDVTAVKWPLPCADFCGCKNLPAQLFCRWFWSLPKIEEEKWEETISYVYAM